MKVNVLIDSFGWIEYFGEGPLVDRYVKYIEKANPTEYYTPTIVLYEVYKKIKRDVSEERALKAYAYILACTSVVYLTEKIAMVAGEISLKKGLSMADSIVKATAELHGAKIITSDRDFEGLDNIELVK